MKQYRVYAEYTSRCYVDVEANSEEEAKDKAAEIDGGEFISCEGLDDVYDWEITEAEEV